MHKYNKTICRKYENRRGQRHSLCLPWLGIEPRSDKTNTCRLGKLCDNQISNLHAYCKHVDKMSKIQNGKSHERNRDLLNVYSSVYNNSTLDTIPLYII